MGRQNGELPFHYRNLLPENINGLYSPVWKYVRHEKAVTVTVQLEKWTRDSRDSGYSISEVNKLGTLTTLSCVSIVVVVAINKKRGYRQPPYKKAGDLVSCPREITCQWIHAWFSVTSRWRFAPPSLKILIRFRKSPSESDPAIRGLSHSCDSSTGCPQKGRTSRWTGSSLTYTRTPCAWFPGFSVCSACERTIVLMSDINFK